MASIDMLNLIIQKLGGIESQLSSIDATQQRHEASLVKLEQEQLFVKQTTVVLKSSVDHLKTTIDACQSQSQGTRVMLNRMNATARSTAGHVRKILETSMKNNQAGQQRPPTRPHLNLPQTLLNRNESCVSSTSEDEIIKDAEFDRKCMAKAIKRNTVAIVTNLPFNDSEIPDMIIPECVNESECETIRKCPQTKDQLRTLVRAVTKRSYEAMTEFIKTVKDFNTGIAETIEATFNELKQDEDRSTALCTVCEIKENVDVKDVCDHYYQKELITDDLHRSITKCDCPVQGKENWNIMLSEIANHPPDYVITILISALKHKGPFFSNFVKMLERDMHRRRRLVCRCRTPNNRSSFLSIASSVSARSMSNCSLYSIDDFSSLENEDNTQVKEMCENITNLLIESEVN